MVHGRLYDNLWPFGWVSPCRIDLAIEVCPRFWAEYKTLVNHFESAYRAECDQAREWCGYRFCFHSLHELTLLCSAYSSADITYLSIRWIAYLILLALAAFRLCHSFRFAVPLVVSCIRFWVCKDAFGLCFAIIVVTDNDSTFPSTVFPFSYSSGSVFSSSSRGIKSFPNIFYM